MSHYKFNEKDPYGDLAGDSEQESGQDNLNNRGVDISDDFEERGHSTPEVRRKSDRENNPYVKDYLNEAGNFPEGTTE